ncbi:MAG TPA: phosphoribosyl-ATP diphosphatase [Acidimicrobiia bacterium]
MIIPSIDISRGQAVQLVEGEAVAIEAGDPFPLMERFSVAGEVAVIDIDAARGQGDNRQLISELCRRGRVRLGGGIRDLDTALWWLDQGVSRIIIGTAATPEFLLSLPRERVIVALDSRDSQVLSHGWRQSTGETLLDRVSELNQSCDGFLVTFVEREGRLGGTDLDRAKQVIDAAGDARVTVAGGISTVEEIAELDRLGADAQVGMALYTGDISLADALAAPLVSDRADGLWPTVVVDEAGVALGLAWSSHESLRQAIETKRGAYESRSRGLWIKGETSGAVQELVGVAADCDRDTLRFTVRQHGAGFCHTGERTCWGSDHGFGRLQRRILATGDDPASNTRKLLRDPALLAAKIREEAEELAETEDRAQVVAEAADLLYFLMVKTAATGVGLDEIEAELDRRAKRVTRRPMVAKDAQ